MLTTSFTTSPSWSPPPPTSSASRTTSFASTCMPPRWSAPNAARPTLLAWFNLLQDTAHGVDDILDEIYYKRLADVLIEPRLDLSNILDTPASFAAAWCQYAPTTPSNGCPPYSTSSPTCVRTTLGSPPSS